LLAESIECGFWDYVKKFCLYFKQDFMNFKAIVSFVKENFDLGEKNRRQHSKINALMQSENDSRHNKTENYL